MTPTLEEIHRASEGQELYTKRLTDLVAWLKSTSGAREPDTWTLRLWADSVEKTLDFAANLMEKVAEQRNELREDLDTVITAARNSLPRQHPTIERIAAKRPPRPS